LAGGWEIFTTDCADDTDLGERGRGRELAAQNVKRSKKGRRGGGFYRGDLENMEVEKWKREDFFNRTIF